jgi:molybdenum cofactor guanylyltransferase
VVAVLAGGRGRRIGGEKALADLGGQPLVRYPLAAASAAGLRAVVVAKRDTRLPPLGGTVTVLEPDEPRHPLCGVLTALRYVHGSILALACDMPFVSAPLLAYLSALGEPALAYLDGRPHPFPGLYLPSHEAALRAALRSGASLASTVQALGARSLLESELAAFGDPYQLLFGINDSADLAAARTQLSDS